MAAAREPPASRAPVSPSTANIATGARTTRSGPSPRWIRAPWPEIRLSPVPGATTARVSPSTRLTAISVDRGLSASATSKAAVTRSSRTDRVAGAVDRADLDQAELAGRVEAAPASPPCRRRRSAAPRPARRRRCRRRAMRPSSITTVAFSSVPAGPRVWTVAPVIATVSAAAAGAAAAAASRESEQGRRTEPVHRPPSSGRPGSDGPSSKSVRRLARAGRSRS